MKGPLFISLLAIATAFPAAAHDSDQMKRVSDATVVVKEFAGMSEGAPHGLVKKSTGVIVIPGLKKAGFVVGGKHGSGVMCARGADGAWCQPVFVKMTGGCIGWQFGVSSTDLVLFFMREKGINNILDGEFTLGGDAAVAAGPVGRTGSASTNVDLDAEIYSYSRSRGAFAGISIEGAKLYVDTDAMKAVYGDTFNVHEIIHTPRPANDSPVDALLDALAAMETTPAPKE
jgi:lipid-binding SYLF domain-containing protein